MSFDRCESTLISKGFIKNGHFFWWRPGDDQEAKVVFVPETHLYRIEYLKD